MALLPILLRYDMRLGVLLYRRFVRLLGLWRKRVVEWLGVSLVLDIAQVVQGVSKINLALLPIKVRVDITKCRINHILASLRKLLI